MTGGGAAAPLAHQPQGTRRRHAQCLQGRSGERRVRLARGEAPAAGERLDLSAGLQDGGGAPQVLDRLLAQVAERSVVDVARVQIAFRRDEGGAAQRLADHPRRLAAPVELEVDEKHQLHQLHQISRQATPAQVMSHQVARLDRGQRREVGVGEEVLRHLQPVPVPLGAAEPANLLAQSPAQRLHLIGVERGDRGADVGRAVLAGPQRLEGRQSAIEGALAAAHGVVRFRGAIDADGDDEIQLGAPGMDDIHHLERPLLKPAIRLEVQDAERRRRLENRFEERSDVAAHERLAAGQVEPQQTGHLRQYMPHLFGGQLMARMSRPGATHLAAEIATPGDIHDQTRRRLWTAQPRLRQAGDHTGASTQLAEVRQGLAQGILDEWPSSTRFAGAHPRKSPATALRPPRNPPRLRRPLLPPRGARRRSRICRAGAAWRRRAPGCAARFATRCRGCRGRHP